MSNRSKIIYDIGFNVEKNALNDIKKQLSLLKQNTEMKIKISDSKLQEDLKKSLTTIEQVENALKDAYNPKIDSTNLTQFNNNLKSSGLTVEQISKDLKNLGADGVNAFRNLSAELLTTNLQLKESSKFLDSMANTLFNTAKWSIASGALNTITGTIQQAWGYAKDLDQSLNNIRIVTGKSNEEMERFAKNANSAAKRSAILLLRSVLSACWVPSEPAFTCIPKRRSTWCPAWRSASAAPSCSGWAPGCSTASAIRTCGLSAWRIS